MKTTQVIKKMVAVGTGLAMVGATILGASATLADYPAPFIKNGMPASNLAIVVGEKAEASDVVGMGDILAALQGAAVTTVASGGSGTTKTLKGDVIQIGNAGDVLELGEEIREVRDSLGGGDAKALASGTVTTDKGSTDYNQYLNFRDNTLDDDNTNGTDAGAVIFEQNDDDEIGLYLRWGGSKEIFQYQMIFEEGFESVIDATADLDDLEGEVLNFLGQSLTVVDTDTGGAANSVDVTLDLMTGSAKLVLEEGETKTVTVGNKEYTVQVKVISETANAGEGSIIFTINGEETDELNDGGTDKLSDGTEIGVVDIVPTGKETQKSIAVVYIGAHKIEITDTDTDTATTGGTLEVNEERIEDANVTITATLTKDSDGDGVPDTNDELEISEISIGLLADPKMGSDLYVAAGHGVREYLDEPEGMLVPNWDIVYNGLTETGSTEVKLQPSGDDEYRLVFTTQEGLKYNIPYLSAEPADNFAGVDGFASGDEDDRLHWIEPEVDGEGETAAAASFDRNAHKPTASDFVEGDFPIELNDWFVLSDCTAADNTCNTHVLRYDNMDTSNRQLSFSDLAGGGKEITYTVVNDTGNATSNTNGDFGFSSQLVVGGRTYRVWAAIPDADGDGLTNGSSMLNNLVIDLNGDGDLDSDDRAVIGLKGLGLIDLGNYCSASSAGTGMFDGDANGTSTAANDCGDDTNGGSLPVDEYDATLFNAMNYTAGDSTEKVGLAVAVLAAEFDEGGPEGADAEAMVLNVLIGGRANNEIGINSGPVADATEDANASTWDLDSVVFDDPNADDNTTLMGGLQTSPDNDELEMVYDVYGGMWKLNNPSGSDEAESLSLEFPSVQRTAQVYVTFGATTEGTGSGAGTSQQVNAIPAGASKLANEVADAKAWNAIVVGGPCANTVAAMLMGNKEPCWETIPENKAIVKLYDHGNGNMAMLVAGRSAMNTRQAARALATGKIKTVGGVNEAFVSGASLTEVQVSAV